MINGEATLPVSALFGSGREMPQAPEVERTLIGILVNPFREAKDVIFDEIKTPDIFYTAELRYAFMAALELEHSGMPVDLITVSQKMTDAGTLDVVGGTKALMQMGMDVVSDASVEVYCKILKEKYYKRRMIEVGGLAIASGFDSEMDCFSLIDDVQAQITALTTGASGIPYQDAKSLSFGALSHLDSLLENAGKLTGIPTGYTELNNLTNGLQPGNLIIVAARPGVGKTAFALQLSLNAALAGFGAGFFSLEMTERELMQRHISNISGVPLDNIVRGRLDEAQQQAYRSAAQAFAKLTFCVDDTSSLDIHTLRSKARRMVQKEGVRLLVVDYLQIMEASVSSGKNVIREQVIAQITRGLKNLAKELHVPIIALSQVNRGIDSRGGDNKKLMLSDLRESGAIEQDANMVIFLTTEDSGKTPEEMLQMPDDKRREATVSIAKNRGGRLDEILMYYLKETQTWLDLAGYQARTRSGSFKNPAPDYPNSHQTMNGAFERSQSHPSSLEQNPF